MIYAGQFFGVNDALWCQSANNGSNIGLWYYPNGTQVAFFYTPSPIMSKRSIGQIALAKKASISGYEGLFTCIILDENGMNQTLVVGAYTNHVFNINGQ